MSTREVLDGLVILLEMLIDLATVVVQIWVRFLLKLLCLLICLQGAYQILRLLVISEEVREMCVSEDVP